MQKGRKPKYSAEIVEKICTLIAKDDYTITELCKKIGISEALYYKWQAENLEFLEAIKKAQQRRLDTFKSAARSGLLTLLHGKRYTETTTEYGANEDGDPVIKSKKTTEKFILPNPTSVIFALKNLDPDTFSDITKTELSGRNGEPLHPAVPQLVINQVMNGVEILEGEPE